MPRAANADLMKDWKICLPATLAGAIEHELMDTLTGKPRYAERSKLVGWLLSRWLAERYGRTIEVDLPSEDFMKPKEQA